MCKIQCLLIIALVGLLACLFLNFLDGAFLSINFILGYVGFLFVCIANFFALKKRIDGNLQDLLYLEKKQKKKQRFSHLILGLQISSSYLRILAYILLIISIFSLMYFKIFVFWSYGLGIALSLFVVVGLQFRNLRKKS